ncbi:GNAT family N-acetyltransferase [Micromonospora sp. NBC_00898]|uniref:GNAT family N-acetyltransferase n=1 Tax=Micromonospora sp. NBC_00898 TaxID=2975981 RepID=UPI0038668708|nr:GNAT family N-acetyltransferase [Micromonospora sp. NBC_00898]
MLRDMGVGDDPPAVQRERFLLLRADPRWALLAAVGDDGLTGYAAAQDHGPHLRSGDAHRVARRHDLYVRPDRRRHGVGRALLVAVSDWAAGRVRYWSGRPTGSGPHPSTSGSATGARPARSRGTRPSSSTSGRRDASSASGRGDAGGRVALTPTAAFRAAGGRCPGRGR